MTVPWERNAVVMESVLTLSHRSVSRFKMLAHARLMQIVKLTGFTSIAVVVIHIALTVRREGAAFLIV